MIDLDDLEQKAQWASPGPWRQGKVAGQCMLKHQHTGAFHCTYTYRIETKSDGALRCIAIEPNITLVSYDDNGPVLSESNAAHIAANSPDVTLALIARIRELEEALRSAADISDHGAMLHSDSDQLLALVAKGIQ